MSSPVEKRLANSFSASHWEKIGGKSHVGINLPLSAIRSKKSSGIGEFLDLLPLISWCEEIGLSVIQLLPLNDSGHDPSPYNALSSIALHPVYLSLYDLPFLEDVSLLAKIKEMEPLNAAQRVPFAKVLKAKTDFLSLYVETYEEQILASEDFQSFVEDSPWLRPYALFKSLLQANNWECLSSWPDDLKYPSDEHLEALYAAYEDQVFFHMALQYLCFLQLSSVKKFANERGVFLKGDLPILISPNSADVWHHVEFFNLELQVGAPPDTYCPDGQNWGFPGLNWETIKRSDFLWWKERLAYAEKFYDLYRVDHAVGLFRLWSIPKGAPTDKGHYSPADEALWGPHGTEILKMLLNTSSMLPLAEDLGIIPPVTTKALHDLAIPGTKVLRWERDWEGDWAITEPSDFDPASLSCVSTHDSPTLEQWWRDFPDEVKGFVERAGWEYNPKITYTQRKKILWESIHSSSLFHISLFGEFLALIPELVDENPDNERINIPGTVQDFNWSYKFQKPIEEIVSHEKLKEEMLSLLSATFL